MPSREKVQADFDLERFIEMFDEALTSNDERVVSALRSLMMMVILTKSEGQDTKVARKHGPLRQMQEDMSNLHGRIRRIEEELQSVRYASDRERNYETMKRYNTHECPKYPEYDKITFGDDILNSMKESYNAMYLNQPQTKKGK